LSRVFVVFMAVLIVFVFFTNALTQTAPPSGPKIERKLSGTVVAVDAASKMLVVKNWRGQTTFNTDGAKLVRRVNLEDIRSGDRITVSYAEEDGRKTAKVLIATPAKPEVENKTEALKGPKLFKDESGKK